MDCVPIMTFQAPAATPPAAHDASAEGGFAALLAGLQGAVDAAEDHATPRLVAAEPAGATVPPPPDALAAAPAPTMGALASATAAAVLAPSHASGVPAGFDEASAPQLPAAMPPAAVVPASPGAAGTAPGAAPLPEGGSAPQPVAHAASLAEPTPPDAGRPITGIATPASPQRREPDARSAAAVAPVQPPVGDAEPEAVARSAVAAAQSAATRGTETAMRPPESQAGTAAASPPADAERVTSPLDRAAAAPPERAAAPAPASAQHAAIQAPHPAQAVPPPPPPVRDAPPPPVRQLAPVVVAVAIPGGTARLAVTLEPAELGRVEISVERGGTTAEVRILAERPETLALLQRDQRELDRALGQAGIGPEERRLSFALAERGPGDPGSGQPGGRHGDGRRGPRLATLAEAASAAEPARRPLSLIDLAI